jgi:2-methylcitrate dehydratase PrpD
MNVAYVVAVALLDGDVLIGQFSQDRIDRDDVCALIGRTLTHHERAYDHLPATSDSRPSYASSSRTEALALPRSHIPAAPATGNPPTRKSATSTPS